MKTRLENVGSNSELSLPEMNSFIPEKFDVPSAKADVPLVHPWIIVDNPVIRIWHKKDDTFLVPKADVYFEIRTPLAYESVQGCVLTRLYTDLLKDAINEFAYCAEVAGLSFNLDNSTDGIVLYVYGYNHKLDILFSKLAHKMSSFPIDESNFERVKDAVFLID